MKGQIAAHSETVTAFRDAGADESCGRELRHIENVRTFEIGVPLAYTGINGSDINGDIHSGLCDVGFILRDGAADIAKAAVHVRQAHVKDGEVDFAMCLVGYPG